MISANPKTLPRPQDRPSDFSELFVLPVNDDPCASSTFGTAWTQEHGPYRRFYVGGAAWLQNNSGLNANRIAAFREQGIRRLVELTDAGVINWRAIPGMQSDPIRYWNDISRQQFNAAFRGDAMFLSKALYVLITCELAIESALSQGMRLPNIQSPKIEKATDVYKCMAIIPACWTVTSFTPENVERATLKNPGFCAELALFSGQGKNTGFVNELSEGCTVQYRTAIAVAEYCRKLPKIFGSEVTPVAHQMQKLASKGAAPSEAVDHG